MDARPEPTDHAHEFHTGREEDVQPSWIAAGEQMREEASGSTESLLVGLTEPQRRAVLHIDGPLLVLAAAGSGKTRVITRRIAHLIHEGCAPWSILALTFTNKAAGEMRERVAHLLGGPDSRQMRGLTVTTFHALCARLLRRYAEHAGLKPDFTIYDSGDQSTLVKKVIEQLQLSTSNFPPRSVLSAISNAKNALLSPAQYATHAADFSSKEVAKIYHGYDKSLRKANAVDFDDLLMLTALMLRDKADVRRELQARWRFLLIDEYQDTNRAQFLIASTLAGDGGGGTQANICVVGDPDQAIYGWRGADISNILDFEQHYPACAVITLGENFRSHAPILRVADTLIRKNKQRKHKDLFTKREGGEPVEAVLCRDERAEAQLVVEWFKSLQAHDTGKISWKDMAVFYRTNALSRVLEDAFRGANIPYTIARGTAFFDREEVKSALAYLRVIANPADGVSLERIINTPSRGISDPTLDKLQLEAMRAGDIGLFEIARLVDTSWSARNALTSRAVASIQRFVAMVDTWTGQGTFLGQSVSTSLADLVDRVIKESGLEAMYKKQAATSQSESDAERLDNLAELVSSAKQFELEFDPAGDASLASADAQAAAEAPIQATPPLLALLRAYLESIALVADADAIDPSQGSVTLMTLHAAKGLEFGAVAIVGLEEGMLPHARALTSPLETEMEEERRLCFVGVTRAMRRLLLTSAKYRTLRGSMDRTIPSRFLSEMPTHELTIRDESDTYSDVGSEGWDRDDDHRQVVSVPARSASPSSPRTPGVPFPVGALVRHPQFGLGVVKHLIPGANARAIIEFQDAGTKTLVLEFARLTRVK
jgi:DNA helicase II / ATP-dependent DNA helicase PcrA